MINEMIGCFEEKSGNKYLVLDDVDENKDVSKKYGEGFKKIRFESNDDLPMNKPIRLHLLPIIIRCVFSEGGKFYPQFFLDDALYKLV